jgi:hypothetical protein
MCRFSSQINNKMLETRQVTQVMVWKLILNPMRANTEASNLVAWSDDKDKLLNWYKSQLVEPYTDNGSPSFECHGESHNWYKVFAKGSELEWYNPMDNEEGYPNHYGHGLQNEWVDIDILPNISVGYRVW